MSEEFSKHASADEIEMPSRCECCDSEDIKIDRYSMERHGFDYAYHCGSCGRGFAAVFDDDDNAQ